MTGGVKRRYESPRRREQARATRRAILDAASEQFLEGGYAGTTIESIAARAGVAPETVYATFRNKRSLLAELVDVSIAGDDDPVPILDRPWVRRMRAEPDPARRVRMLASNGTAILARWTPIYEVLRAAAAADQELAALWRGYQAQRREGQRTLLGIVIAVAPLRRGVARTAAEDVLFAVGSPEMYRLLVLERGWSAARFERWYAEAIARLLLA